MNQHVKLETEGALKVLLLRIKKETSIKWKNGKDLMSDTSASKVTGDYSIGFESGDDGISRGWFASQGKRVSADYFILSLKIYELKQKRKALKEE